MNRITSLFLTKSFLILVVSICFTMTGKVPAVNAETVSNNKPLMTPNGYYTKGRYIYNAKGEKHIFRGVSRPGYASKLWGDGCLHDNEFPEMARWGANIVRIPMNQHWWLIDKQDYRFRIDSMIKLIIENGMAVVIDLHRSCIYDYPTDMNMADEESLAFWKAFAAEYKDNGQVMFELWNEPHDVSAKIWMHGGVSGDKTYVGMQQLYDAIRELGAHNLILISGLYWGYDLQGLHQYPMAKDAYNVVYVTHPFNYWGKKLQDWQKCFAWIIPEQPLLITEFGYSRTDKLPDGSYSLEYEKSVYTFADDNEIGWIAWAWTSTLIRKSIFVRNKPHTYDPGNGVFEPLTPHGQLVKENLLKHKK